VHFYTILFRKSYLQNFQYRIAALINNLGSLIFGFMYIAIWQGTLGADREVIGFGREEMGWYIAFTQTLIFLTTFLPRGFFMDEGIRTGAISLQLMRPTSFFGYYLAQGLGYQAYCICFRCIPIYLVFAFTVGVPPFSWQTVPLVLFSLLTCCYLGFLMNYFVGIAAFWTHSIRWAFIVQYTLTVTFSGFLVPVPIMPGLLADISAYSPFAGLHFYPTMNYLGHPSAEGFWVPLLWSFILTLLALWITRRARRRMEIQGG
jgi:ABC-2 type transport system permease protein